MYALVLWKNLIWEKSFFPIIDKLTFCLSNFDYIMRSKSKKQHSGTTKRMKKKNNYNLQMKRKDLSNNKLSPVKNYNANISPSSVSLNSHSNDKNPSSSENGLKHNAKDLSHICPICKKSKQSFISYVAHLHHHYDENTKLNDHSKDPICDIPRKKTTIIHLKDYETCSKESSRGNYCLFFDENITQMSTVEKYFSPGDPSSLCEQGFVNFQEVGPKIIQVSSLSSENIPINLISDSSKMCAAEVTENQALLCHFEPQQLRLENHVKISDSLLFNENLNSDFKTSSLEQPIKSSKIASQVEVKSKVCNQSDLNIELDEKGTKIRHCHMCCQSSSHCLYKNMCLVNLGASNKNFNTNLNNLCYEHEFKFNPLSTGDTKFSVDFSKPSKFDDTCDGFSKNINTKFNYNISKFEMGNDSTKKVNDISDLKSNIIFEAKQHVQPVSDVTLWSKNLVNEKSLKTDEENKVSALDSKTSCDSFALRTAWEPAISEGSDFKFPSEKSLTFTSIKDDIDIPKQSIVKNSQPSSVETVFSANKIDDMSILSPEDDCKYFSHAKYGGQVKSLNKDSNRKELYGDVKLIVNNNLKPHFYFDPKKASVLICADCYSSVNRCDLSKHYKLHGHVPDNTFNIFNFNSFKN